MPQSGGRDQSPALLLIRASGSHTAGGNRERTMLTVAATTDSQESALEYGCGPLPRVQRRSSQRQGRFTPSFRSSVFGEPPKNWVFLHLEVTKGKSSGLITM